MIAKPDKRATIRRRASSPRLPGRLAWQCQACGVWLDRDVNAAVNVAKAAMWRDRRESPPFKAEWKSKDGAGEQGDLVR